MWLPRRSKGQFLNGTCVCLICLSRNPTMFIWSIAMKKTMNHILRG